MEKGKQPDFQADNQPCAVYIGSTALHPPAFQDMEVSNLVKGGGGKSGSGHFGIWKFSTSNFANGSGWGWVGGNLEISGMTVHRPHSQIQGQTNINTFFTSTLAKAKHFWHGRAQCLARTTLKVCTLANFSVCWTPSLVFVCGHTVSRLMGTRWMNQRCLLRVEKQRPRTFSERRREEKRTHTGGLLSSLCQLQETRTRAHVEQQDSNTKRFTPGGFNRIVISGWPKGLSSK